MSKKSKSEYLREISQRYLQSDKAEKQKILDEFCKVCSYNRKYAIRILNNYVRVSDKSKLTEVRKAGRKKQYHTRGVKEFLKVLRKKTNLICSKRLKPAIALWIGYYKKNNDLSQKDEALLKQISPATIDRVIREFRGQFGKKGLSTTRPGSMIRELVPIRTNQWDENRPGFIEVDLVAHCGSSVSGQYVNTLNSVDIATGWNSMRAVWGKGEANTRKAIREIELSLPFKIRGFDSDNGKEFLNYHLLRYFKNRKEPVSYTRARAYNKNDNSHIEEKNWTRVRQYVGYDRMENPLQLELLNDLYLNALIDFINYFLPSMKLKSKIRKGSKLIKKYDKAQTPFQRLFESKSISEEKKLELLRYQKRLDPFKLQIEIDKKIKNVLRLSAK